MLSITKFVSLTENLCALHFTRGGSSCELTSGARIEHELRVFHLRHGGHHNPQPCQVDYIEDLVGSVGEGSTGTQEVRARSPKRDKA